MVAASSDAAPCLDGHAGEPATWTEKEKEQGEIAAETTASPITVVVNGPGGPRCTLEASTKWTILEVHNALVEKIDVQVSRQSLVKGTEKLAWEAILGSLIPEGEEKLELTLVVLQGPRGPVNFVGLNNSLEQLAPGHLKKTGGCDSRWASAVSSESIAVGGGRGLRFRPGTTDKTFVIGLGASGSPPADHTRIDFAAWCRGGGHFYVFEGGLEKLRRCPYTEASIVEVRVTEARQVEFVVDGVVKYTAKIRWQRALYCMACFFCIGGEALEIQWL